MAIGNKNRKKNLEEEEDALMQGLASALLTTANRNSVISAQLSKILPNPLNGRIGQSELVEKLPELVKAIASSGKKDEVPNYEDLLQLVPSTPALSNSAQRLFDNCVSLANSIISTGGYTDSPPKVMPVNAEGFHLVKTGHRRYFAYCLAEPVTNINVIDILLDKSTNGSDQLIQTIERLTENTSREDNSLAEYINEVAAIFRIAESRSESIVKSKLAKQIGMERTKLGRIIEIVECGAANDAVVINKLHELRIADVTAVNILFKQPKELWLELVDELHKVGPVQFRAKYRAGTNAVDEVTPTIAPEDTKDVISGSTVQAATSEGTQKGEAPPQIQPLVKEVVSPDQESIKPVEPTKNDPAGRSKIPAQKNNIQEAGASRLLELVADVDKTLVDNLQGSAYEKVMQIIERLGRE